VDLLFPIKPLPHRPNLSLRLFSIDASVVTHYLPDITAGAVSGAFQALALQHSGGHHLC
jgi:hypothetical protein